eukprot:gb/GEZN01017620.1/.p1 GENE.gb/GEZN01017620.1/~~gb/GEZN01017620.1/.p1  ORF type:complete len:184 (+),score=31.54 gb/GEZN01017620.1/:26-577(+)
MSKLQSSLSAKYFQALIEGLIRREFYSESLSNEFLKDQIFATSDLAEEAQIGLIAAISDILKSAALRDWDIAKLQQHLKDTDLSEEHAAVFLKAWKKERSKVHQSLVDQSSWDDTFKRLQWRIDVKSGSSAGVLNEPTAIVQLDTTPKRTHGAQVVQFEISKEGVQDILQSLDQLDYLITSRT